MPCAVTLRGLLEPITIEDDFSEAMNSMNMLAAQGKQFIVTKTDDGENLLLNLHEILSVVEAS